MTAASTERVTGEPTDERAASSASLDADERFHLLQNERRRLVLRYLRDATAEADTGSDAGTDADTTDADADDGRVWMRDVAEQVAAWEHDTTVAQLSSTQRQRVYIPLYQNHLPKLDDAGVIEYDQSRGVVVPTDRLDHLVRFLDVDVDAEAEAETGTETESCADADADATDAWHGYYLGASGVGAVMLGGAALSLLPGFAVAAAILALFSTVSLLQYLTTLDTDIDADEGGA